MLLERYARSCCTGCAPKRPPGQTPDSTNKGLSSQLDVGQSHCMRQIVVGCNVTGSPYLVWNWSSRIAVHASGLPQPEAWVATQLAAMAGEVWRPLASLQVAYLPAVPLAG